MATVTNAYRPTSDLVHEQVALYEVTDGRDGGTPRGRPVVILTTIGAKTGNLRKNPVMRIKAGEWPRFAEFRIDAGDREIPVAVFERVRREDRCVQRAE